MAENSEPTTVTDLGRIAGCSIATVSRVLNNSGAVSAHKREAILKAIQETEFYTSRARRGGRRVRSKAETGDIIEIIQHRHSPVEKLSVRQGELRVGPLAPVELASPSQQPFELNSFYRNIVDGAIEELARWNYRAHIRSNTNLLDPALFAEINVTDRGGVLLVGEYSSDLAQFARHCRRPLVLVDLLSDATADVVTTDNLRGITDAFTHLWDLGHRKIGFVGSRRKMPGLSDERYSAYRLNMVERGLPLREDWVYYGFDHIEQVSGGVTAMLEASDRPTALMCQNDCCALGVVRAASRLGISIPGQLSVTGFDDVDFASLVTPPLTTVRVCVREMGRQAVRQLMIGVKGGAPPRTRGCHVRLLPELIVRESTAAIAP